MSGTSPTQDVDTSQWTLETLKQYFEMRFNALEAALDARFNSQEKAIAVASVNSEKRFDATNEWRLTVDDITKLKANISDFTTFKETVAKDLKDICKDIDSLEITRAELAGKATSNQVAFVGLISIAGLVLSIIRFFL